MSSLSLRTLAALYTLFAVASAAALVFLGHDMGLSDVAALSPLGPPELSQHFLSTNADAVRISAFFCFASAIPLVIYTAVATATLDVVSVRRDAVYVAFAGGLVASGGLAVAGLLIWVLSVPDVTASIPVMRALHYSVILTGGVGFAVGQGLMAAGASIAARDALPRWIAALGMLIAVSGALSTFGMLSELMTIPIPITRVGGFVWLIAAGAHIGRAAPLHGPTFTGRRW